MSKTSSTSNGETKQDDVQLHFLGSVLIYPYAINEVPTPTSIGWWTLIFSFLDFNVYERLCVRNLCRLFHTVLPGPTFTGVYTIYPHPNHTSLRSLMFRLNEMARRGGNIPEHLFITKGIHDEGGDCVIIFIPISIVGESREHCIVIGGLHMSGKKEDDVNVSNLTLRDSKGAGVRGYNGASIHLNNVSVENSEGYGVFVYGTKRSTMKNCNVSHSKLSGLHVLNGGLMTIDGNGTTIHHNCTGRYNDDHHGLHTYSSSDSIHLASSLTIETISKNNGGGLNYGGKGTIAVVNNEGTVIETIQEATLEDSENDTDHDY